MRDKEKTMKEVDENKKIKEGLFIIKPNVQVNEKKKYEYIERATLINRQTDS